MNSHAHTEQVSQNTGKMTGIKSASATAQLSAGRNGGKLPGVEGQTCNNWTFDHTTAIIKSHEVSRCQEHSPLDR